MVKRSEERLEAEMDERRMKKGWRLEWEDYWQQLSGRPRNPRKTWLKIFRTTAYISLFTHPPGPPPPAQVLPFRSSLFREQSSPTVYCAILE